MIPVQTIKDNGLTQPKMTCKPAVKLVCALKRAEARAPFAAAVPVRGHSRVRVGVGGLVSQGSAGCATLGWGAQFRWDGSDGKAGGFLFQPFLQVGGIAGAMPDRGNFNFLMRLDNDKVNGVWPINHPGFATFSTRFGEEQGMGRNRLHYRLHLKHKTKPEAFGLYFIPGNCLAKFHGGCRIMDNPKAHYLYLRSISSRKSSQGVPRPGFFRASSARRSSSATCCGVNSASPSPNSAQIFSATSYCSSGGNRRICSNISTALMPLIYRAHARAQVDLSPRVWRGRRGGAPNGGRGGCPAHSSFSVHHSAFAQS